MLLQSVPCTILQADLHLSSRLCDLLEPAANAQIAAATTQYCNLYHAVLAAWLSKQLFADGGDKRIIDRFADELNVVFLMQKRDLGGDGHDFVYLDDSDS